MAPKTGPKDKKKENLFKVKQKKKKENLFKVHGPKDKEPHRGHDHEHTEVEEDCQTFSNSVSFFFSFFSHRGRRGLPDILKLRLTHTMYILLCTYY